MTEDGTLRALGIEMTEFRDGPPIECIVQQIDLEEGTGIEPSSEDLELKFEEDQDQRDWLSDDENERIRT